MTTNFSKSGTPSIPPNGKNLVVLLDGTANKFGRTNTNVVRLYQATIETENQRLWYDPGVGTAGHPGLLTTIGRWVTIGLGLGFGLGATDNIRQAYQFLMRNYQVGDRIFLFGFSRGALEARALAALIHRCGILKPELGNLDHYALNLARSKNDYDVSDQFGATFSRPARVHFLGLWDTVTSMGNIWSPIQWPHTSWNTSIDTVRHAIAMDERRSFFRQNRWNQEKKPSPGQNVDERWFPGVHCDVGGGYDPADGALWTLSHKWISSEAVRHGLTIDENLIDRQIEEARRSAQDPEGWSSKIHRSMWGLPPLWFIAEFAPKARSFKLFGKHIPFFILPALSWLPRLPFTGKIGRPRRLMPGEALDRSVVARYANDHRYGRESLKRSGLTPEIAERFLKGSEDKYIIPNQ